MNTNSKESPLPGMFSFGRRKKSSTLTSVVTRDTGVTISQIEHTKKGNAVLHTCDFTGITAQLNLRYPCGGADSRHEQ